MRWLAPHSIIFTELSGTIKLLDTKSGEIEDLYQVEDLARDIQSGLMGMALHPSFEKDSLVYISRNYRRDSSIFLAVDVLHFENGQLNFINTILGDIPSFPISIGGRIHISEDEKLFITVGEGLDSEAAQDLDSWAGKVLRVNLDGSVPEDNPDPMSPVWSRGFRNPQGITSDGENIYITEHGTFSNDELNLVIKGANYGWPLQSGFCDPSDSCGQQGYTAPISSWTPTVAPSGASFYQHDRFPFIKDAILVSCLKGQKVLISSTKGQKGGTTREMLNGELGRLRDVLVNPEGRIFVSTSNLDVYGVPREGGDGIFEITPIDSFVEVEKTYLSPPATISLDSSNVEVTTVAANLRLPWELVWVEDNVIWFNERGGAVKRLDLSTGDTRLIHQVEDVFESSDNSGMHGFTVHPDFPKQPFFYVHYTYEVYRSRLVRFEVDSSSYEVLGKKVLLPDLEGNKSHNGSRITFGPDGCLYFCIGDGYKRKAAQDLERSNGKILRLKDDGSIPEDNPFPNSYVWSLGHRNPQGLEWSSNGILYSSEHGSSHDDELNIIEKGRNYGFPNVQGQCEGWFDENFCRRNNVKEPIYTWTPTIGPSGICYYGHTAIPEWTNSLLVATLKSGDGIEGQRLLQVRLSDDGAEVEHVNSFLTYSFGRLRDVMAAPDGRIFICTSNRETNQNAQDVVQETDDRIIQLAIKQPSL